MAEAQENQAAPEEPKKKSPIVVIGAVAALMLIEAVGVYVLVGMTTASDSYADEIELGETDPDEQISEVKMIHDRFQNRTTGRVWQWEAEIVLKVRQKHLERVNRILETRASEIKEGIGKIIASALDRQLSEPGRTTIDRQVTAYVDELFGHDAEGVSRVDDVLIPTLTGNPADF
ncbi:MAG: hypothetical protein CMJ31_04220 [Phycisphaerae bacterium]|nr:hypothetical protein [Phycisphaerae bacterium]